MPSAEPPLVAIACQGGGSHAAFGAGVLHRLLDDLDDKFRLAALSGTSGGAVNATLAWSGLIQGGRHEAQRRLAGIWRDLEAREAPDVVRNWWGQVIANLPFTWEVSPYMFDLGAREEMVTHLRTWARLEELPRQADRLNRPTLFVGTTDIENGVSVAIRGDGQTVSRTNPAVPHRREAFDYDDVIASIAIPPLYRDVKRRGTAFWDGLFSINPPVYALTQLTPKPDEIWVVRINPQRSAHAPSAMHEITDRRNELAGNLSLNKELDMIEAVNGMLAAGHLTGGDYKRITLKIVGIDEADAGLSLASKFDRTPDFLQRLFRLGVERAPDFYDAESERPKVRQRPAAATTTRR